jgi:hypothetical protein
MKIKLLLLVSLLGLSSLTADEATPIKTADQIPPPESFTYGRLGVFTYLYVPLGIEGAIGHRYRSEHWGWGPLGNISTSFFSTFSTTTVLSILTLKFEVLYYPEKWHGIYFGLMPGIGIAHLGHLKKSRFHIGVLNPTHLNLEIIVFGKEFVTSGKKRQFCYVSITPIGVISFDYGWGF